MDRLLIMQLFTQQCLILVYFYHICLLGPSKGSLLSRQSLKEGTVTAEIEVVFTNVASCQIHVHEHCQDFEMDVTQFSHTDSNQQLVIRLKISQSDLMLR